MQIQTVNVIEMTADDVQRLLAYPDTPEGNAVAVERFAELAVLHGCRTAEVETFAADGLFEQGEYQLFLVHSRVDA